MKRVLDKWNSYKYRFVPWLALNIKNRSSRVVKSEKQDKIISDEEATDLLLRVLPHFRRVKGDVGNPLLAAKNSEVMAKIMGFTVERGPSSLTSLQGSGTGVFVRQGNAPKGTIVALYPGTIYRPYEPILLQSLGNSFIFRCIDGTHIDGKSTGISKAIYKSCVRRDIMGGHLTSDLSWLTQHCINPMNVGQYVNNQSKGCFLMRMAYANSPAPKGLSHHRTPQNGMLQVDQLEPSLARRVENFSAKS